MIRRLVEAHYARHRASPAPEQVAFWLREARTPAVLAEVVHDHPDAAATAAAARPLVALAAAGDAPGLESALAAAEVRERETDRAYWAPLREELERLRHQRRPG